MPVADADPQGEMVIGGFDGSFSPHDRARITAVLRRLSRGEAVGQWRTLPERIDIHGRFDEGASGVLVIAFTARFDGSASRHVAKIGLPEEIGDEWRAYREVLHDRPSALCPPIVVVTEGVLDDSRRREGEDEAVVYIDAEQFSALPGEGTQNLEQLVGRAVTGSEEIDLATVTAVVSRVVDGIARAFQRGPSARDRRDRKDVNASLGPDLRVAVNTLRPGPYGFVLEYLPASEGTPAPMRYAEEIVDAALAAPDVAIPGEVHLAAANVTAKGSGWQATRDTAVVEVVADDPALLTGLPPEVSLRGKVLATRSQDAWRHLRTHLKGLDGPGPVTYDAVTTAHPFAMLHEAVTGETTILAGGAHGDVNARNVLIISGQPFLIDYARARSAGVPVTRDPAWLELNLMRRPLGRLISYGELVRVQRLLFLADRVVDLLPQQSAAAATEALFEPLAPAAVRAAHVLTTVRQRAARSYPADMGELWWRGYQVELLLAAQRALKWRESSPDLGRAHLALAAVATEALSGSPFAHWPDDELAVAVEATLAFTPEGPATLPLLGDLAEALEQRTLDGARHAIHERLAAAAANGTPARERVAELKPEHERHMDLPAMASHRPVASAVRAADTDAPGATLLVGPAGCGKTATLRELEYRLLTSGRLPIPISADDLLPGEREGRIPAERIEQVMDAALQDRYGLPGPRLRGTGAVRILIDDLHRLPDRTTVLATLCAFSAPVVATLREIPSSVTATGGDVLLLQRPSRTESVRYLARSWRDLAVDPVAMASQIDTALEASGAGAYGPDERAPQLLAMLGALPPSGWATRADVLEAYLGALLKAHTPDAPGAARRARELAGSLGSDGSTEVRYDRDLRVAGLVVPDGSTIRFARQDVQDYFTAQWLLHVLPPGPLPQELVLGHRWRQGWQTLVSLSSTGSDLREQVIELAVRADPIFAARLLSACPPRSRPVDLARGLLARLQRTLADSSGGPAERAEAAAALAATAAAAGFRRLLEVLAGPASVQARRACLEALTTVCVETVDETDLRNLHRHLSARCGEILADPNAPQELLIAALETVGRLRLDGLALLVTDCARPGRPRQVVLAALRTLTGLEIPRSDTVLSSMREAAREVLADMPGESPIRDLEDLIGVLDPEGRRVELLSRRTAFGLGEWSSEMIDRDSDLPMTADTALAALHDPDEMNAAAALHTLLRSEEGTIRAFAELAHQGRADRVAAIIRRLPEPSLPHAFAVAREILATLAADPSASLEGAASLVTAVHVRDPDVGFELARTTHRRLADAERADRLARPWAIALLRCSGGYDDLDRRLASPNVDLRDLAVDALADHSFLNVAGRGPAQEHRFSGTALSRVRALVEAGPTGLDPFRIARAGSGLAITPTLDIIRSATLREDGRQPRAVRVGDDIVEMAPLAEMLAAAGYLVRVAALDQDQAIRTWLAEFTTHDDHPSVEVGRRIGLAYLGEWLPLFDLVESGQLQLVQAAHNVLDHWLPDARYQDIVAWADERLPSKAPGVRDALFLLRAHAESLAGRSFPRCA